MGYEPIGLGLEGFAAVGEGAELRAAGRRQVRNPAARLVGFDM